MSFHKILRIAEHRGRADKSAMCTINRHLLWGWTMLFICVNTLVQEKGISGYLEKGLYSCLRQNQMHIPEFVPEVALLQRFAIGDLEMFQARESLQHGEVGRAWFVQAGDHGVHCA